MGKKKTPEQFNQDVFDCVGMEYRPLEPYRKSNLPLLMRHETCGYEWLIRPNQFLSGRRCPICHKPQRTKTPEQFEQEVLELGEGQYVVLTPYRRALERVVLKHLSCGLEWEVRASSFLSGHRCPRCMPRKPCKTPEQFRDDVHFLVGEEFEVLTDYQHAHMPIRMRHRVCGYEWETKPSNFLVAPACPCCRNLKK